MKPNAFYTLENSIKGATLQLKFPDGTASGQSIVLRGTDSPEFQKASREKARERVKILTLPEAEQDQAFESATRRLLAALVISWTLDAKVTPDSIDDLFVNAPHVMKQVDDFCVNRANFFNKPPVS